MLSYNLVLSTVLADTQRDVVEPVALALRAYDAALDAVEAAD